jgi:hypothetical protein
MPIDVVDCDAARPGLAAKPITDLIQELTDAARAECGLPSVSVWEE